MKQTSKPSGATRPRRLAQKARKKARAVFLRPFEPLQDQIDAARQAEVYPFFTAVDEVLAAAGPDSPPVVLVANDYLGLSADLRVREAARQAVTEFGTSRCASPLAGGYTTLHETLELRLAAFLEQEAATLFASGYQANVGAISSLVGRDDVILTDLYNHASIVDGSRLSGAEVRHFRHNSPTHLETLLRRERGGRRVLVVVEGVYSADGDIAELPEICAVAHRYGALVMIDEAHSFGVLGSGGRGAADHFDLLDEVDLIMGTMSKSLASVGGFVAGDRSLIDAISHSARSLIFSAALPPASSAAALKSLEILEAEPERRARVMRNARLLLAGLNAQGFDTMGSETPVVPILVRDVARTIEFAARLRDRGVLVCPAIPPMVPGHLSRIRMHVTAAHDEAQIERALSAIGELGRSLGIAEDTGQAGSLTGTAKLRRRAG